MKDNNMDSLYSVEDTRWMWEELEKIGVRSLRSAGEVDKILSKPTGTVLVVINSICGCATAHARPAVGLALQNKVIPDDSVTVFAGVDREATARAREHITGQPPSSPSIALFKNGRLVFILHRSRIEGRTVEAITEDLVSAFDQHCTSS